MKKQKKIVSKPRNHVVLAMSKRAGGAGTHTPNEKAQRQQEKLKLKKMMFD